MQLFKFQSQVGGGDAYAIRARQLDDNFSRVQPVPNGQYGINETSNGWSLNIFPPYPEEATETQAFFLSYVNGAMEWGSGIVEGTTAGAIFVATETDGSVQGTWSSPPQIAGTTTTGGWRLVERCDGQQMYVWGTDWVDPA